MALQIPVGQGPAHTANPFRGVIDLVTMQLLDFPEGKEGNKIVGSEIPAELADEAQHLARAAARIALRLQQRADGAGAGRRADPRGARSTRCSAQATLHLQIQPVLCGSALHGMGVQPVLDAVAAYLPSPLDMPPVEGFDVKTKGKHKGHAAVEGEQPKKIQRKPDPAEPFCGLVFKILPFKTGDSVVGADLLGQARSPTAAC